MHNEEVKIMQSTKGFREEFSLDTIYELIKDQAPRLVCELEAKYAFESEKKYHVHGFLPQEKENYENLTRVEKFEILGWISSASNRLVNDMAFGAISYINLSTMRHINRIVKNELDNANQEEWKFFERGYELALKNK